MPALSPARVRFALIALALGGFGIGTTEFVAMGLLPNIARDLLPQLMADDPEAGIAKAGWVISAYALGVVIGAPLVAGFGARLPRRGVIVGLAIAFTLGTLASALAPTFETLLVARFLAALPHGAYFGMAALAAASLLGPGRRAQGVALVMSGLTISNIVGVPLATLVGQTAGWRASFLLVTGLFAATAIATALSLPPQPGDRTATMRRELGALLRGRVWAALLTGALGFGGFFAVYSYIAPLATEVTGFPESNVPWVLVAIGVGMTTGNLLGGKLADAGVHRAIFISFGAFALALLFLALFAASPVGLIVGAFLVGGSSSALLPGVQTRLMDVAGQSQTLAAAINHSAFNVGNSLGAALGGAVIAAGFGYIAPTWLGLMLCVPGVLMALLGIYADRVRARMGPPTELVSTVPFGH